jgi:hypothetical protein
LRLPRRSWTALGASQRKQIETAAGKLSHEDWIDKLDAEDAELRARAAKLGIIDELQH